MLTAEQREMRSILLAQQHNQQRARQRNIRAAYTWKYREEKRRSKRLEQQALLQQDHGQVPSLPDPPPHHPQESRLVGNLEVNEHGLFEVEKGRGGGRRVPEEVTRKAKDQVKETIQEMHAALSRKEYADSKKRSAMLQQGVSRQEVEELVPRSLAVAKAVTMGAMGQALLLEEMIQARLYELHDLVREDGAPEGGAGVDKIGGGGGGGGNFQVQQKVLTELLVETRANLKILPEIARERKKQRRVEAARYAQEMFDDMQQIEEMHDLQLQQERALQRSLHLQRSSQHSLRTHQGQQATTAGGVLGGGGGEGRASTKERGLQMGARLVRPLVGWGGGVRLLLPSRGRGVGQRGCRTNIVLASHPTDAAAEAQEEGADVEVEKSVAGGATSAPATRPVTQETGNEEIVIGNEEIVNEEIGNEEIVTQTLTPQTSKNVQSKNVKMQVEGVGQEGGAYLYITGGKFGDHESDDIGGGKYPRVQTSRISLLGGVEGGGAWEAVGNLSTGERTLSAMQVCLGLQCVVVCCSVLQCVKVPCLPSRCVFCCSVLQCVVL